MAPELSCDQSDPVACASVRRPWHRTCPPGSQCFVAWRYHGGAWSATSMHTLVSTEKSLYWLASVAQASARSSGPGLTKARMKMRSTMFRTAPSRCKACCTRGRSHCLCRSKPRSRHARIRAKSRSARQSFGTAEFAECGPRSSARVWCHAIPDWFCLRQIGDYFTSASTGIASLPSYSATHHWLLPLVARPAGLVAVQGANS